LVVVVVSEVVVVVLVSEAVVVVVVVVLAVVKYGRAWSGSFGVRGSRSSSAGGRRWVWFWWWLWTVVNALQAAAGCGGIKWLLMQQGVGCKCAAGGDWMALKYW
jgi:hypothetical protein